MYSVCLPILVKKFLLSWIEHMRSKLIEPEKAVIRNSTGFLNVIEKKSSVILYHGSIAILVIIKATPNAMQIVVFILTDFPNNIFLINMPQ